MGDRIMEFFRKYFDFDRFTLYPLGDTHIGSKNYNDAFFRQVIQEIAEDELGYWVGMGDFMENALIGSKSDVYTQTMPPTEQANYVCELLEPIWSKGLFLIAGNHEQRTMRAAGFIPEQYIAAKLKLPYLGFSAFAYVTLKEAKWANSFVLYFHHNYGGGYTKGGKVNRAEQLRRIAPNADAIFSGHFHITSRTPTTWFDATRKGIITRIGYDYITGSALEYKGSYAEERAKPAATCEFIKVTFKGGTNGHFDGREQIYEVIIPKEKE
jgi:hypothetical protein